MFLEEGCLVSFAHALVKLRIWKQTLVPEDLVNYRPTFTLSFISNTLDKAAAKRLGFHGASRNQWWEVFEILVGLFEIPL